MRTHTKFLLIVTLGWISVACVRQQEDKSVEQLINRAMQLTGHPDSALFMLGEMDTTALNTAQYAKYVLAKIQAKDIADIDIQNDTVIFTARDFCKGERQ